MNFFRNMRYVGCLLVLTLFLVGCTWPTDPDQYYQPAEFDENGSVGFLWSTEFFEIIPRLVSAISKQDPVTVFVSSHHGDQAAIVNTLVRHHCHMENVRYVHLEGSYDNIWIRDFGPQYMVNRRGERKLVQFQYFWTDPGFISDFASLNGLQVEKSDLNGSGGSREINGKGVMILCEMHEKSVNPGISLAEIEEEMKTKLGITKVIWLKKGLPQDDSFLSGPIYGEIYPKGVDGHVDEFCRFADESTILITSVTDEEAGKSPILAEAKRRMDENYRILENATDQNGKAFRILEVPIAPLLITDRRKGPEGQIITSVTSYMNFIISNSLIILPGYLSPDSKDKELIAKETEVEKVFREAFPDRDLIKIRADTINLYSGGFHCISIHEPK